MPTEFEEFGMAHFFMLRDRKKILLKKSGSEVQNLHAPLSIINIFVSLKDEKKNSFSTPQKITSLVNDSNYLLEKNI